MNYLVMECHPAYAVVLDEEGRFLKTANLNYQRGQVITQIVPSVPEAPPKKRLRGRIAAASLAACLCLVAAASWQTVFTAYGTIRLRINPDIQLTVNRWNYVIGADGLNREGTRLISGWKHGPLKADDAAGQLSRRAAEQGYLKEDGTIRFSVDSEHPQWQSELEDSICLLLEQNSPDSVTVTPVSAEEIDEDDWEDEEAENVRDDEDDWEDEEEEAEDSRDDEEEEDRWDDEEDGETEDEDREEPDDETDEDAEDDPDEERSDDEDGESEDQEIDHDS